MRWRWDDEKGPRSRTFALAAFFSFFFLLVAFAFFLRRLLAMSLTVLALSLYDDLLRSILPDLTATLSAVLMLALNLASFTSQFASIYLEIAGALEPLRSLMAPRAWIIISTYGGWLRPFFLLFGLSLFSFLASAAAFFSSATLALALAAASFFSAASRASWDGGGRGEGVRVGEGVGGEQAMGVSSQRTFPPRACEATVQAHLRVAGCGSLRGMLNHGILLDPLVIFH